MSDIDKLKILYDKSSKHSNYQILSEKLSALVGGDIRVKSRNEKERLDYILKNVDVEGKYIVDIGGNTGFFSFELIAKGARHVYYFEGNTAHADFVNLASNVLGISSRISVANEYVSFDGEFDGFDPDMILLLNVLHHLGDDYGDRTLTIEMARKNILRQLNSLANKTPILIFQLGFNWKGDKNHCLFTKGTKDEMIDFVSSGVRSYWDVLKIGIAEKVDGEIVYNPVNDKNIERDDSLGEFLNRPVFILKSKILEKRMG